MEIKKVLEKYYDNNEVKDFDKIMEMSGVKNRSIVLDSIEEDTGMIVESIIRFWNRVDKENGIPADKREPIKIYIDSPGGYLTSTFSVVDAISMSKTPVWTINIGSAYSGGFFIFIAGHKRFAYPLSSFLYHEGSGGFSGDANKFQNQADFYKKQREKLKELTLKYTKVGEDWYETHVKDDVWLFADEAVELGIADEIITEFV